MLKHSELLELQRWNTPTIYNGWEQIIKRNHGKEGFNLESGMQMTVSGDGWMGIAPVNQKITMRSLDFRRCEKGLIRENWVLVDLLISTKTIQVAKVDDFKNKLNGKVFLIGEDFTSSKYELWMKNKNRLVTL